MTLKKQEMHRTWQISYQADYSRKTVITKLWNFAPYEPKDS